MHDLFNDNLDIPEKVARRYRNCGVASYLELLTVAQESLLQSSTESNKTSTSFRAFARHNAKGAVLRYIHWCSYGTYAKFGDEYVVHYPISIRDIDDENELDKIENNHIPVVPEPIDDGPSQFDIVSTREYMAIVCTALNGLPERNRDVFLSSLAGYGSDELAAKLRFTRRGVNMIIDKSKKYIVAKVDAATADCNLC